MTARRLVGPVSPTPPIVYDIRIFKVRLFGPGLGSAGVTFLFKGPYGSYMTAAQVLARAVARQQIGWFALGAASPKQINIHRKTLTRFDEAFARVGTELGIDWAA